MKKRLVIAVALATVMAAGTAFASPVHPGGLGVGVLWGGVSPFGGGYSGFNNNAALSLKVPAVDIFWGAGVSIYDGYFGLGIQGDRYFLGTPLLPTLSWFLGLGAYANFSFGESAAVGLGVRLPIGLTWQPIPLIEVFGNAVATFGVGFNTRGEGNFGFRGGIGPEIGIRLWLGR